MHRLIVAITLVALAAGSQVTNALACGGLVAPNGSVRLARATTLVAWHNGVEHYLTSFAFQGDVENLGWIVPLPVVPSSIKEGGAWTLQRLEREFAPPLQRDGLAFASAQKAVVIERVQVEALDITVIRGSGSQVLDWCEQNGFVLPPDTRAHLVRYAQGSPIFMAAKYNLSRARARHQTSGDGAPVLITMRLAHPWVPLEVLANDGDPVSADLFLLSDKPVSTGSETLFSTSADGSPVAGATGFTLVRQEPMNPTLYHDLSTDRNMSWVPSRGFVSYLTLNAPSQTVDYDLTVTDAGHIKLVAFGTNPLLAAQESLPAAILTRGTIVSAVVLALIAALLAFTVVLFRWKPGAD